MLLSVLHCVAVYYSAVQCVAVTLWREQPVFPARAQRSKYMLLGGPLHENIKFPWLDGPTQNTDSLFEIVSREFDMSCGPQGDPSRNDASTSQACHI